MPEIVAWIRATAQQFGGPGLFFVAFLDSSVLSLPEINDILVVWMVTRHKERMAYYAAMATLGSIAGCALLYALGYTGGQALLAKRFREPHLGRAMRVYARFGALAVLVPAMLPPPAPFKIFVLMAGVSRMRPAPFASAIAFGRGVRYFGEGLLAIWYGDAAIEFLRTHGKTVSLIVAAAVVAVASVYVVLHRRAERRRGL